MSAEPALAEAPQITSLAQKLVEVATAVEKIDKDKRFPGQGHWAYASAEAVLTAVRGEFLARNVLVLGTERDTEERQRQTSGGGDTTVTTIHVDFIFLDAQTGERIELSWLGRGEDPADRGVGKALTNAIKTFLRQQLLLPWGDDPEADDGDALRGQGGARDSVNLIAEAKGLGDNVLNQVLVANGLAAAQNPFGVFARIPANVAPGVSAALAKAKEAKA